jgi:hypothetical protein
MPQSVLFIDRPNFASIIAPPRPPQGLKPAKQQTPQGDAFRSIRLPSNGTGMMTGIYRA